VKFILAYSRKLLINTLYVTGKAFLKQAVKSYLEAGGLIMLRTISKISAYSYTASAAARLGPIPMAAYSLTFNLGFATSQLCEVCVFITLSIIGTWKNNFQDYKYVQAISIAAQALLARDVPFNTEKKLVGARHIIKRALLLGVVVSGLLTLATLYNQNNILAGLTKTPEVRAAAAAVMPVVLLTQIIKGLAYSTGGILLGGLDWFNSSAGMGLSAFIAVGILQFIPGNRLRLSHLLN
jgi:Na+-driven multidrug efflux pump